MNVRTRSNISRWKGLLMMWSAVFTCGIGWAQPAHRHAPSTGNDAGGPPARWASDPALLDRARAILKDSPVIDGHSDLSWYYRKNLHNDLDAVDLTVDTSHCRPPMRTDIPRLRRGGVGAQFWAVYVPPTLEKNAAVTATLEQIDLIHRLIARYPDTFEMASSADDIQRICAQGRIASLLGIEGGHSIGDSLAVLRTCYLLGARYMTLTHSKSVGWADSSSDDPLAHGLTPFGIEVVHEMNRLGMMVDLSHVTSETMRAVLDVSRAPVVFTHSNAAAVCPSPRNVPDDVLLRLRDNGGIVMVTFLPAYIHPEASRVYEIREAEQRRLRALYPDDPDKVHAELETWEAAHPEPGIRVTLADLADHIDYIRKTIGIDHVGVGGDFEGFGGAAEGLEDVTCYPAILAELLRRGYSDDDVRKVAGQNLLRVFRDVEHVARQLQSK